MDSSRSSELFQELPDTPSFAQVRPRSRFVRTRDHSAAPTSGTPPILQVPMGELLKLQDIGRKQMDELLKFLKEKVATRAASSNEAVADRARAGGDGGSTSRGNAPSRKNGH
jgi:hypothetical protein